MSVRRDGVSRAIAKVIALAILAAVVIPLDVAVARAASDDPSLGISKNFKEHERLTILSGQTLQPTMVLSVDNAGPVRAETKFTSQSHDGIEVQPVVSTQSIPSGQSRQFAFGVAVADFVAAGEYEVRVNVEQTNVKAEGGGIVFVPAVGASFVVAVEGSSGTANISVVDKGSGNPVSGRITIGYSAAEGQPMVPIQSGEGSTLSARLAVGDYAARFEIPGLVSADQRFSIADGETREVKIVVDVIYFPTVAAIPQPSLDDIVSAKLVASISNKAAPVKGPIDVVAIVASDGIELETVEIAAFPKLPSGLSDVSSTYVPLTGWTPGEYSFRFQLVTPEYTVEADAQDLVIPASTLPWVVAGVAVAVIILLVLLWFVSSRRKRRR